MSTPVPPVTTPGVTSVPPGPVTSPPVGPGESTVPATEKTTFVSSPSGSTSVTVAVSKGTPPVTAPATTKIPGGSTTTEVAGSKTSVPAATTSPFVPQSTGTVKPETTTMLLITSVS